MTEDDKQPSVEPTRPIIICGVARSGTTFTGTLLDTHPAIALTNEFFLYKTPSVLTVFDELQQGYASRWKAAEWSLHRSQLMKALWLSASCESQVVKSRTARRIGNKTPGSERYFEFYDHVFAATPPLWIYVLREGRKVFISRKNMKWGNIPKIQGQAARYLESVALFEAYQQKAPDRICLVQWDQVGRQSQARFTVVEQLLAFVGECMTPEVHRFVSEWPVINAAQQQVAPAGEPLASELLPEEQAFLDGHEQYQAVMQRYGYQR